MAPGSFLCNCLQTRVDVHLHQKKKSLIIKKLNLVVVAHTHKPRSPKAQSELLGARVDSLIPFSGMTPLPHTPPQARNLMT